jgi:hypothetical protein
VITPTEPGALVRSRQQCLDFRLRQKMHQGPREALAGNREHALDLRGMSRCLEGRIPKE